MAGSSIGKKGTATARLKSAGTPAQQMWQHRTRKVELFKKQRKKKIKRDYGRGITCSGRPFEQAVVEQEPVRDVKTHGHRDLRRRKKLENSALLSE